MTHPYSGGPGTSCARPGPGCCPCPAADVDNPVHAGDDWQLDHLHPVALGGGPDTARPAHRDCNARAGVQTREQIKAAGVAALRDGPVFLDGDVRPGSSVAGLSPRDGHPRWTRWRPPAQLTPAGRCPGFPRICWTFPPMAAGPGS